MPGEIEFLDADDGPGGQDEDHPVPGPRRRWRRWAIAAGTVALAGALAAAITTNDGGRSPKAVATTSRAPSAGSAFVGALDLALPHGGGIQAAALVGGDLVVLAPGYLARVDYRSGRLQVVAAADVGLPLGDPHYAEWRLVTDGRELWAVTEGPGGGRVTRVDPATMRPGEPAGVAPPAPVVDAAALDGHLYLNTERGVYDLAPTDHAVSKQPVTPGGQAMAVDPARHRLLLLGRGDPSTIRAYSLSEHRTVAHATLPFRGRSLTVVDGTVWVAGIGDDAALRPVLARLDPVTLRVVGHSPVRSRLPGQPTLVAGQADLWVHHNYRLWCVDATTGAIAQQWSRPASALYGAVVSPGDGQAFVAGGRAVGRLRLDAACDG